MKKKIGLQIEILCNNVHISAYPRSRIREYEAEKRGEGLEKLEEDSPLSAKRRDKA